MTENLADFKISTAVIDCPMSALSGEWPGDEEVDG